MRKGLHIPFIIAFLGLSSAVSWLVWPATDLPAWKPPPLESTLPAIPLATVLEAEISLGSLRGMEDITTWGPTRIGGTQGGHLLSIGADHQVSEWNATGGRPLGLAPSADGNVLWIADAMHGLLFVGASGQPEVAVQAAPGGPIHFANDLDVARDGSVYLTDSSRLYGPADVAREFIAHRPTGRLLRFDPSTARLNVLLDDLYFANGVTVAPDQSWVMVAETAAYRVTRHWLQGPRAGTAEPVLTGLPGLPDNLFTHDHCLYWVALFQPRSALLDAILPYPLLRAPLLRLPISWLHQEPGPSALMSFDLSGTVYHYFVDREKRFTPISGGHTDGERLYIGSLEAPRIGVMSVPALPEGSRPECP